MPDRDQSKAYSAFETNIERKYCRIMVFFECKPFYNMDLYNKYPLDIVSWSTPIKTLSPIDLFALTAPFYIIPIGYSMTLLALLFEYLIGKKEAQLGRSELGSDNRINVLEENSKDVDVSENEHEAPNPLDDDLDNDLAENGHEAPTSIDVDLDKYVAPIEEEPFA